MNILEKIKLVYHRRLNPKIFNGMELKEEVRLKLLEIARAWADFAKIPEELIEDIILTGGNANYLYNRFSDLDVHIVLDRSKLFSNSEYVDEYLATKKTIWSLSRNIKIKNIPVEMYAQDINDKLAASGVYSLLRNEWLSKPVHGNYSFKNDKALEDKVQSLEDTINQMIDNHMSPEAFIKMKNKLKLMRKNALSGGDEMSFDNLAWKALRNTGILDRMNEYLRKIEDEELSL